MLFVDDLFLLFFAVCFLVHWSLRDNTHRKIFLCLASIVFYSAWDWRFSSLLVASGAFNWMIAREIERHSRAVAWRLLVLGVGVNLLVLFFFKYFNFFTVEFVRLAGLAGFRPDPVTLSVILPVGVSFYTFHSISYIADVYMGRIKPAKLLDVTLYIIFFPQLVAGPIVRGQHFLPQLESGRQWSNVPWRAALLLFLIGYFKKSVVADNVALLIDPIFANPLAFDAFSHFMATVFFGVQIYCDFSGYTDMALATSALLGYRLMINFDAPYLATNIVDFWRRWHISLSFWLRDYLYIPLGGNRGSNLRVSFNLMATMMLGGLWHGAAWTYVLWGTMHGAMLVAYRLWAQKVGDAVRIPPVLANFMFMWWFLFSLIFVRAPDLSTTFLVARGYVLPLSYDGSGILWVYALVVPLLFAIHVLCRWYPPVEMAEEIPLARLAAVCGALVGIIVLLKVPHPAPFIYFQF